MKAFTFLEILVVLAIISVMLMMLMTSFVSLRRTMELQQANDQIVLGLNQTKNFMNNNILPDNIVVDPSIENIYAYKLNFENNNISRQICWKTVSSTLWSCDSYKELLINEKVTGNILLARNGCNSLLMINLTGDYKTGIDSNYSENNCEISLSHTDRPDKIFRVYEFLAQRNTFNVKIN